MRFLAVAMTLVLIVPSLEAQQVQKGSWAAVTTLQVGQRIKVARFTGRQVGGKFVSAEEDAVTVRAGQDEVRVERSNVRQVQIRAASGRLRNAGIGAAVGAGVGLGLGGLLLAATGGSDFTNELLLSFTGTGAALGFGIGWIPPGYRTVYKVKR